MNGLEQLARDLVADADTVIRMSGLAENVADDVICIEARHVGVRFDEFGDERFTFAYLYITFEAGNTLAWRHLLPEEENAGHEFRE